MKTARIRYCNHARYTSRQPQPRWFYHIDSI